MFEFGAKKGMKKYINKNTNLRKTLLLCISFSINTKTPNSFQQQIAFGVLSCHNTTTVISKLLDPVSLDLIGVARDDK